jgi:flagellar basal-body rod modification protein FlgD
VNVSDTQNQVRQASTSLNNAASHPSSGKGTLGKDDFLNLLMTQMTHQDPLNPMDSQGMMNQLTTMGSLEQMMNVNKQLDKLNQTQTGIAQASAYSFLDKDVTLKGGVANVLQGGTQPLQFQIPREAESIRVDITDASGAAIRTLDVGAQGPGKHTVIWDARDNNGDLVADSAYPFMVTAKASDNDPVPVETLMHGKVSGVRFDNGRPMLKVNGQEVDIREIIEMSNQSQRLFGNMQPYSLREAMQPLPPQMERRR